MPEQIWFKISGTRLVSEGSISERYVNIVIGVDKLDSEGEERTEALSEVLATGCLAAAMNDFRLPATAPFKLDKIEKPNPEKLSKISGAPLQLDVQIYELKD
jgi:hypothetical protein